MSKYRSLSSYFHENEALYQQMLEQRFQSEGTFQLPFFELSHQAFVVMTREMSVQLSEIGHNLYLFDQLTHNIPYLNTLVHDAIFKEIEASNEIEGIHSSRKELQLALSASVEKPTLYMGQIQQYLKLVKGSDTFPETAEQIRELYNELLLEDIRSTDPQNIPDGRLFRKNPVYVHDGIKTIHTGILPEEKIIQSLENSLTIINDDHIPSLVRMAVFHFLFGYIHPFYDGNGRMNRYLSSLFLAKEFSPEAGLQLSLYLRKNRKSYYHAFERCEDPLNQGDLTPFVLFFLDSLNQALENEIDVMRSRRTEYDRYLKKIHSLSLEKKATDLLILLAENKIFNMGGLTVSELKKQLSVSENTVRKYLHSLAPYLFAFRDGKYKRYDLINDFITKNCG